MSLFYAAFISVGPNLKDRTVSTVMNEKRIIFIR